MVPLPKRLTTCELLHHCTSAYSALKVFWVFWALQQHLLTLLLQVGSLSPPKIQVERPPFLIISGTSEW